jgi:phosphatidylglycerol:prolipoprotein diacylglycerol transferase
MHPEIFHIGPFALRSFGLMLALSFFVGIVYIRARAIKEKIDVNFVLNLAFVVIFSGIAGARIFYVAFHWSDFADNLTSSFNPFGASGHFGIAGLNLYGGVVLAIVSTVLYVRHKKQQLFQVMDIFAPALALGICISRIGCFLNGCCFGMPCDLPFGISFPPDSIPYAQFGDAHLHPTQLYSSLYGLLLFFFLHRFDKGKKFFGATFSMLLMVEAVFRFLIEYVRYYEPEMETQIGGITFTYNHLIAIALFALGLTLFLILRRNKSVARN